MIYEDVSKFANELKSNNYLIGLDLGTKTIGVAVSDIILSVATPIKTIKRKKFSIDSDQLLGVISIKNCCGVVFGLPKNTENIYWQYVPKIKCGLCVGGDMVILPWNKLENTKLPYLRLHTTHALDVWYSNK